MSYLVIRVRSDRGVTKKIRDTMSMLNLTRVNHAVLVPKTPAYEGMLQKAKDFVTWGPVSSESIAQMIRERGRLPGDRPVDDAAISECTDYDGIDSFAAAVASGDAAMKDASELKRVFRLHPPRGSK